MISHTCNRLLPPGSRYLDFQSTLKPRARSLFLRDRVNDARLFRSRSLETESARAISGDVFFTAFMYILFHEGSDFMPLSTLGANYEAR